ncbi:MAG: polymer-forming cytoskeletal protein [Fibrobacterales bacterium]
MANSSKYITILSSQTEITGELIVKNDIRVAGKIKGKLQISGNLVVEPTGRIEADVTVDTAIIAGIVEGDVIAKEKVVLEANSKLFGNITTKELVIVEGALFRGNCSMDTKGEKPAAKNLKKDNTEERTSDSLVNGK